MNKANRYPPEVRERAVRMVFEHEREYSSQWSAMCSIAKKIGRSQMLPVYRRNIIKCH